MRARPLTALLALVGAAFSGLAGAQGERPTALSRGFRIQAAFAYEGSLRMGEAVPLIVRIENLGADAAGALQVGEPGQSGAVRYPVSLPSGAKKAIPISATSNYGGVQLFLETDRGAVEIPVPISVKNARASLLAIGDGSGGFGFLGSLAPAQTNRPSGSVPDPVVTAYAKPEAVPEGEAGLDRISCIALMPGSERLNARQIGAIRNYVLRGGHLVFFGGASAPILSDPRFSDLIPYSALTPGDVSVGGRTVSIQRPRAIPSAQLAVLGNVPIVRRAYGVGRVSFFAADPVDGPFESVPNRAILVARALDLQRSAQMVSAPMQRGPDTAPSGKPVATPPGESDPFALEIPPTNSILVVLGAYFVIVLPVNFLVLRAFKRLEWAWFTTPLLAIGFAGLLFRNAGSLYKTGLSYATQTAVIAASGGHEGLALGRAQLFFPGATRGPIPIPGAEAIGTNLFREVNEYGYSSGRPNAHPLDVLMTDGPSISNYSSAALEFRGLDFRQRLDLGNGIRVIETSGPSGPRIEVFNGSPYTLDEIRVFPARSVSVGNTRRPAAPNISAPGDTLAVLTSPNPLRPGDRTVCSGNAMLATAGLPSVLWTSSPVLVATIASAPVGPQLGANVASRTTTRLVVSGRGAMNAFESLVTKNPMTVEIRRAARRYLTFSGGNGTVTFGSLLGIILYAILVLTVVNMRGDIHPKVILGIQLFVASLIAPMTLHASIAGERERRSWDMLMVAPVTHAQVIVGKLLGGLAVQVAIAGAMLIPTLVAAVSYTGQDGVSLYGLFRIELVLLSMGIFCSALTMLISARVKRSFVALGVSFTVLLLLFVFLPTLIGMGGNGIYGDLLLGWHPGWALAEIDTKPRMWTGEPEGGDGGLAGFVTIAFMLGFTAILTAWTVRTVAFADNEVRFLPGKKKPTTD